jgi:hypothetical protein
MKTAGKLDGGGYYKNNDGTLGNIKMYIDTHIATDGVDNNLFGIYGKFGQCEEFAFCINCLAKEFEFILNRWAGRNVFSVQGEWKPVPEGALSPAEVKEEITDRSLSPVEDEEEEEQ